MRFLLVVVFLLGSINLWSGEVSFERISTQQGLSQSDVLSIFQDSKGYLWFGTHDGLNRYDGYSFRVFRNSDNDPNSVSSNLFRNISEDKEGNLWIVTQNNGISIYYPNADRFRTISNSLADSAFLTDQGGIYVYCDSKDRIWLTSVFGINFIQKNDNGGFDIIKINKDSDPRHNDDVWATEHLFENSRGEYIVSSNLGVYKIEMGPDDLPTGRISELIKYPDILDVREVIEIENCYLVGCQAGIVLFEFDASKPDSFIRRDILKANIQSMVLDAGGNMWAGGHSGLYYLKHTPKKHPQYKLEQSYTNGANDFNLSSDYIRSLYIDRSQILWIGTVGGGICKYDSQKRQFRKYGQTNQKGSLSDNRVLTVYEDSEKSLWVGTQGGGMNLLPHSSGKNYKTGFKQYDVNPATNQNFVFDLVEVQSGIEKEIWAGVGYYSKFSKFIKAGGDWKVYSQENRVTHSVFNITQGRDGTVWLGSYNGGLTRVVRSGDQDKYDNFSTTNSSICNNIIRSILEDTKGRLWIGTGEGLMVLAKEEKNKDQPKFITFIKDKNDQTSLSDNYVLPIFESSDSTIWIGTLGGGLNKYIEGTGIANGSFQRINMDNGLPNNVIKEILEDQDGMLWISSNMGLTRYNPRNGNIINYGVKDGLQDNEFGERAGCVRSDGEIIFGGINGFNAFYPDEITEDSIPPNVVFTHFELMNQLVEVGKPVKGHVILNTALDATDQIVLKHKENNFTIHFAALHFSVPNNNQYMYKLDGFDTEWVRTSAVNRFAKYTNLQPGKYVFNVNASNGDGIWAKTPRSIEIRVEAPFWQTSWFRWGVLLLIVLIVAYRFRSVRQANIELERIVKDRTNVLQQQKGQLNDQNEELTRQTEILNETNTQLEERQQIIEEQSEELRAQKESLEEVNATKDKFYSILAHDVKNPFNALLGYLELLKLKHAQYDTEKRGKMIGIVHESAKLIYKLMENLLEWSRSQQGLLPFKPIELDIRKIIDQEVDIYNHVAAEKGIDVVLDYQISKFEIYADENMLKTIIRNLLSNAIKYTKPGDLVKITIQDEGDSTLFSVSDTGVGIPVDVLENLFRIDRHYSTEGTANEKGTGLGLVLCKEFVETHKGRIWIESKEDKGTTFFFTIPKSRRP